MHANPESVLNKVAIVTGAGSGIGRSVALALARAQYKVVLAGRRRQQLEAVAAEGGQACWPVCANVADEQSVNRLFAQVAERWGRLDLLFNNAGLATPGKPLEDTTAEQWRAVIETNLTGVFLCTRAAFRLMKTQKPRGGRIINNGSISATVPRPYMIAYTASKHAVTGLTKATALEGRQYDIACGQLDIGNTSTSLASALVDGALQADFTVKSEPTFDVQHVADAVLYMAGLPLEASVLSMTVIATKMPYVGRG
jgi:NAD(P)-dependent dehydrogenase (short-subunit alcohol dehydrogenase family)